MHSTKIHKDTGRKQTDLSVVIVTYNRKEKLLRLLESIRESSFACKRLQTVVVDNGSTDGTRELLNELRSDIDTIYPSHNLMCGGGRNEGAKIAEGKYILFIDDDNILEKNCLSNLVDFMERNKQSGVCAPLILDYAEPDTVWCAGGILQRWGQVQYLHVRKKVSDLDLKHNISNVDFFPNSYLVRRDLLAMGVWHDTVRFPHNWTEADFCKKVVANGYTVDTVMSAVTYHDVGYHRTRLTRISIANAYDQARSRVLFRKTYERGFKLLYFMLIFFPLTTLIYMYAFLRQPQDRFKLIASYFRGYWDGLRKS